MLKLEATAVLAITGLSWAGDVGMVKVLMETSKGKIVLELNQKSAPKTVENFLSYAEEGFYSGTIFHRVIQGFMIQGGGFSPDMEKKETKPSVENEAFNGLKNNRGTISMARTPDPHSASSQFFINTVNNSMLDFKSKTPNGWGYCVFGKVVDGMAVVDAIEKVKTGSKGPYGDVPLEPVIIKRVTVIKEKTAPKKKSKSVEMKPPPKKAAKANSPDKHKE